MQSEKDHDLLIKLSTQVEQVLAELREMKNGSELRMGKLEGRVDAIEQLHDQVNPLAIVQDVKIHNQWIRDFDTRWKTIIAIASLIGGIIGFIVSVASKVAGII